MNRSSGSAASGSRPKSPPSALVNDPEPSSSSEKNKEKVAAPRKDSRKPLKIVEENKTKRKRGRPAKSAVVSKDQTVEEENKIKRKRGRPPKSEAKGTANDQIVNEKRAKRGRPAKSKETVKDQMLELREVRTDGTWVECTSCKKWRHLRYVLM